jgi:hypothetical protein
VPSPSIHLNVLLSVWLFSFDIINFQKVNKFNCITYFQYKLHILQHKHYQFLLMLLSLFNINLIDISIILFAPYLFEWVILISLLIPNTSIELSMLNCFELLEEKHIFAKFLTEIWNILLFQNNCFYCTKTLSQSI